MTDTAYVVEIGRRRARIDTATFPTVRQVADRLASHWTESFKDYGSETSTPRGYATALRDLLGYLNGMAAPPQDLRFVDESTLDGWVDDMRARLGRESTRSRATSVRVLLDNIDVGELHETLSDDNVLRWRPDVERGGIPLSDLAPGQWAALRKLAKRSVIDVTTRIQSARAIAANGCDPGDELDGWRIKENIYWVALNGRLDVDRFAAALYRRRWPDWLAPFRPAALSGTLAAGYVADRVKERLLPTLLDMAAFWTAMAVTTGLPPESVNDLEIDWFDTPPGGDLTILRYRKQRQGSATLPLVLLARPRFSAQQLRDSYVALSAPLRPMATPGEAGRLWLFAAMRAGHEVRVRMPDHTTHHFTKWVRAARLLESDYIAGVEQARTHRIAEARSQQSKPAARTAASRLRPLEAWTGPVDPRRVRKTNKSHRLVMFGLAAAANDHTVRVLIAHYTNSDLVRVRSALVITEVAEALTVFAAGPRPTTIITAEAANEVGTNATARAELSGMLGITEERLDAVLTGRHTIGAVACIDPYASPHDNPGRFCRQAGSDLCLSCSQAIVLAEHVPALWSEIERLDRIAATMSGEAFARMHSEHHATTLDALGVFDLDGVATYRARGVIPIHPIGELAPVPLRRRRVRQ